MGGRGSAPDANHVRDKNRIRARLGQDRANPD